MNNYTSFYINSITINTKKFELLNIVSETGNSIYTILIGELTTIGEGKVFISEDKIKDFVIQLIEQRVEPALNNKNE